MENPLLGVDADALRRRRSLKWRLYGPDVLPLWVAEMDVAPPPPVVDAVCAAMAAGDTGYAWGQDLAEAVAGFAQRRWGWSPDPRAMRLVPDVMLGVTEVLKLITSPGDAVVVNPPVYPPFHAFVSHLGRRVLEAPLGTNGRLDVRALELAFVEATATGGRAAYLLCNPHNPTGTVHTREELTEAGELAVAHGVRVVADEVHGPLVYAAGSFTPYLSLPVGAGAFTLTSASKGFNLAGLNAAVAIPGDEARRELAAMPEEAGHGASHLGVIAQTAAMWQGDEWLDALLAGLDDNRRLLAVLLDKQLPELGYRLPEATYLAWLDCRALGLGDDPAAVFRQRGRVALTPGSGFGTGGAGFARLNFATSPEIIHKAVLSMAAAVAV